MLGHIEPYLKDIANRLAIVHDDPAKHGFVVSWNTEVNGRIDLYAACRKAKLLENPRLDTLHVKVRLHSVHESQTQRFRCGKERETGPRPMNLGTLFPRMPRFARLFFFGPYVGAHRVPKRVFLSAKNPPDSHFRDAALICSQPAIHQFFDSHNAQPFVSLLEKSSFRELLDEAERAHDRNSRRLRQLRSALIVSARRGEIQVRDARRQQNL